MMTFFLFVAFAIILWRMYGDKVIVHLHEMLEQEFEDDPIAVLDPFEVPDNIFEEIGGQLSDNTIDGEVIE